MKTFRPFVLSVLLVLSLCPVAQAQITPQLGNIRGPASSTVGDVATFADVYGRVMRDSGVNFSAPVANVVTISGTGSNVLALQAGSYQTTSSAFNAQVGTTYELVAADNGKTVTLSNADPITLTVPDGLGAGFSCVIVQLGAGQVTVTGDGTTINNPYSHTKLQGQFGSAVLTAYASDTFLLSGDTTL